MKKRKAANRKIVAENRKARFNYEIARHLRGRHRADRHRGEVAAPGPGHHRRILCRRRAAASFWLFNAYIPEYLQANRFNHEPRRPRKLLLHKREINRLIGAVQREGMTIVPLKIYFNDRGRAKVELALARGKKLDDKRETEKKRDWQREKGRLLRDKG